ncbi:MAG: DUF5060 domain-containing protein [Limisphaerales bacterium]
MTLLVVSTLWLKAAPVVTSVKRNAGRVGKYAKLELTVGLNAHYTNAYNPDDIDLWGKFTSPSRKVWRINGFYDGAQWRIRFAANETGDWSYIVRAKDATGTGWGTPGRFTCKASANHGWVRIAPNHRYLAHDDGTSFYGVGACYPWGNTTAGFDRMQALGMDTYVYWNGTYDRDGGNNLIESTNSGIGHYDQGKCARLDKLIAWSEERGLGMILVVWPHDYLSDHMRGWPSGWSRNPYKTITSSRGFYGDTNAWAYQEKMYRYIIARWGYSAGLAGWQTIDEIAGTSGWTNRGDANVWAGKIAAYFQNNDPFQHPTTASEGDFWDAGNKANDLPNTEIYRNNSTSNLVSTIHRLWDGYEKPCIMGETGLDRSGRTAHRKLWVGLASGLSVTPLFWSFNQGWNNAVASQFAPFEKFIAGMNFAGLTSLAQAKIVVPDAGAYGITSDQLTFGWITGDISGKTFSVTGLKNGAYRLEWWDCATGVVLSTKSLSVANGSLSAEIPVLAPPPQNLPAGATSSPAAGSTNNPSAAGPATASDDLAFKIIKG